MQEAGEVSKLALRQTPEERQSFRLVLAHSRGVNGEQTGQRWVQAGQANIHKSCAHLHQTCACYRKDPSSALPHQAAQKVNKIIMHLGILYLKVLMLNVTQSLTT